MANPTGIKMFLDKLKLQLEALLKVTPHDIDRPLPKIDKAESPEEYTGLPLEIGNELLITDEIVKAYGGLSRSLGRVVIVDQISTKEDEPIKASAFGIQINVDMKGAGQMREAFLLREQA